ncbi:zinc finger BED domain-containing protein 5-like [Tachysurus ichikawai]
MINLIKSRPLNSRLFGVLCHEMGSGHEQLLLHRGANELSIDMQEQLIELKSDSRLKELFSSCFRHSGQH